jgi:uncharacterized membrane protein YsdA (DUF1294 family)
MLAAALLWLVAVNLWTMLRFSQDKRRAILGTHRIREAELLQLAFVGGTPGAFAARHLFRHKTRKQPFSFYLMLIVVVQAGAAIGLIAFQLGG